MAMNGLGDLSSIVSSIESAVGTTINVASDPYLPETLCHMAQLQQIGAGRPPATCTELPAGIPGGVGLGPMMPPLRAYVYAQAHPWAYAVAAAVVIGIPLALGYTLGKGSK